MTSQDAHKIVHDFAVKWFEVHAGQRLKMFNFFILISGIFIGGYFTALQANNFFAAMVAAFVLVFVAVCFKFLDRRTAQLVWIAEDAISETLKLPISELGLKNLDIIERASSESFYWSYRKSFNLLFGLFAALGVAGVVVAYRGLSL